VARAIEDMAVRGAPAIGVTAAMAVAIELGRALAAELAAARERACARLARTRPTAVNLAWALARMSRELGPRIAGGATPNDALAEARALAQRIHDEDVASCRAIGDAGARSCRRARAPTATRAPGHRRLRHPWGRAQRRRTADSRRCWRRGRRSCKARGSPPELARWHPRDARRMGGPLMARASTHGGGAD
jgi:hypothetical protein